VVPAGDARIGVMGTSAGGTTALYAAALIEHLDLAARTEELILIHTPHLADKLPGPVWARGMLFSVGAWLLMMVVVMPMAGAGFFAAGIGPAAAIVTLVLHLIFGAVLGGVFDRLTETTGYGRHSTQTNEGRA